MRTILFVLALCLWPGAAAAEEFGLKGQWQITAPSLPNYIGVVMIDAERRATWDAPNDKGKLAKFRGYVVVAGPKVEILFTDSDQVVRCHCTAQSGSVLHCYNVLHNGKISDGFVLTRVGPGPQRLVAQ